MFSTRVLPILLNNCSASGCHGGRGEDMFRLERLPVAESSRKLTVGRNLERVLAKVDRSQPGTSLLLTANTGPHARAGRVVIAGPKGIDQLRTVREWVESLSGSDFGRSHRVCCPRMAKRSPRIVRPSRGTRRNPLGRHRPTRVAIPSRIVDRRLRRG